MSGFVEGQFATGAIPVLEKALSFHKARNTLLARNIANASTPNYRPVDLDEGEFKSLLRRAVAARARTNLREFRMPPSERFSVRPDGTLEAREVPVREGQVRHDGNAVNMDREMAKLADNTIAFERTAQMLASSFRVMEIAIRGRA